MREPIFYGGEAAYDFQYLDFSVEKYAADDNWLKDNKGFSTHDAKKVISQIIKIHQLKIQSHLKSLRSECPEKWTLLPAFMFNLSDLELQLDMKPQVLSKILLAFCLSSQNRNNTFKTLSDFNQTNACPLISLGNNQYLLFQHYSLLESFYESPFYWMYKDKKYLNQAKENRGAFVENFSAKKMRNVFGEERVFLNLDIYDPKKSTKSLKKGDRSEIDILVVFGNRAIILQSKAKRLSLEARKGNNIAITKDFKASIQDSYDQGLLCARLLNKPEYILVDKNFRKINISQHFTEIYIFCVIPDHYPALSLQANQFLKWEEEDNIKPPFVMDVFFLDVMTEMLFSPLYFLSYANRRTGYIEKIIASHEITILSFFMKNNPWLEEDQFIALNDDISSDIDSAMIVRRLGISGKRTPDGALSRLTEGWLGKILKMIERTGQHMAIDLGFLLLTLSVETINTIEEAIEKIFNQSKRYGSSDLSFAIGKQETGLTIHSNKKSYLEALASLENHCEIRKYIEKAKSWYGLSITPENGVLKFIIRADYPWTHSNKMEIAAANHLAKHSGSKTSKIKKKNKIGVNERCPCGSGFKFKKCCKK